ncbi:MAG TPA: UvrD-helicase domain-containing protein [Acidimicrobiales bacterium]|nr:UvrD-helicase domain-containing protein [Acidimicrobiales bacterium]
MNQAEILEGLNDAQREAVTHPSGPLLVVAGAGSGKTKVLTHRIANLIAEYDVHPGSILAITFTNKAAAEMKRRVEGLVGPPAKWMWVSTFHSACVRILRSEAPRRGYRSNFTIYDQSDSVRLVQYVLRDLDFDAKKFPPKRIASVISSAKAELVDFESYRERSREGDLVEKVVADVYPEYQRRLFGSNAMDFDDLLMLTHELLNSDDEVLARWRARFSHVMVDEYQDTNKAQAQIAFLLGAEHRNVCVVGDADQSIYSWRKADIRNIMDFEKTFPGAKVVLLEQNYRSTEAILDAANAVISNNVVRRPKDLWTATTGGDPIYIHEAVNERDEASWITAELLRLVKGGSQNYSDIAIFYRTNAQSRALEEQLVSWSVPYQVLGGVRFYDRREIKDLIAYLKVVGNSSDEVSLKRIINVPKRGVGDTSVAKLDQQARAQKVTLHDAMECVELAGVSGKALKGVQELVATLEKVREMSRAGCGPRALIEAIIDETGYMEELEEEQTVESAGRIDNILELLGVSDGFETLEEMLESVSLVADADGLDTSGGRVVMMTIHTAKGLEFPVVFMVGMEEGIFPHGRSLTDSKAIEEERRLAYVGITRARKRLYVTYASSRGLWGDTLYNRRSRFIDEIPSELSAEV